MCNYNCKFCSNDNLPQKEMSLNEFSFILNEIKPYTHSVYLHIKGEPLIHSEFEKIIKICEKRDMKIYLTTNGSMLKQKIKIIKSKCIKKINISIHSNINDDEYIYSIVETIRELIKNKMITLRFWNNQNGIINEKNKIVIQKILSLLNIPYDINNIIYCQNNKIIDNLFINIADVFEWPNIKNTYYKEEGYCLGGQNQLGILADGTVVPCCLDSGGIIKLGNIYQNNLKEILNSERYLNIKKSFQNRKAIEELCKKCSFKSKFDI